VAVTARNVGHILGVAVATAWALSTLVDTRHASAGQCPDVEVVSARGVPDDPYCSEGNNEAAHHLYDQNGMTDEAAAFVASRL
jgi:hypothetical protein